MQKTKLIKKPIEELIPYIKGEIAKRRSRWTLNSLSFDDVAQTVLIRVVKKYEEDKFIEGKGEFSHWVNTVITNAIWNVLRDNYLKYARPCVMGCIHNTGDNHCSLPGNKSGIQCVECPLYRDWHNSKKEQYNINQPLALEGHFAEVEKSEFFDFDYAKDRLNEEMKKRLRPSEWKIYKRVFIDRKTDDANEDTIKSYGLSYPNFSEYRALFLRTAKKIIEEEALV